MYNVSFFYCMSLFININNREQLKRLFLSIDANAQPLWGKMTPQQMVEHLVENVQYTNGKKIGFWAGNTSGGDWKNLKINR